MKIKYLILLLVFCTVNGFAQKKNSPAKTLEDSLAILAEFQKEMRKALMEEYKASSEIKDDRIDDESLPAEITDAKAKELLKLFTSSFFFRPSSFSGESSQLLIEADNFFFPGPKVVEYQVKWLKALDKSNKDHLAPEEVNNLQWSTIGFSGQKFLKLKDTFQNKITKVEAEIAVKTPSKIVKTSLDKSLINKATMAGNTPVKLLKIENDFASVWIGGKYDPFTLLAFNKNNLPLDITSNSSFIFMADKESIKELKLPKDIGPGSLMYIKAYGTIDRVELIEVAETIVNKTKATISPKPVLINGIGPVNIELYENAVAKDFSNLKPVQPETLKNLDKLKIFRKESEWDKSVTHSLEFKLPGDDILLHYADAVFKNIKYFNKKKMVKESEQDGYYDAENNLLRSTPQDEDYKQLEFDEAQGEIVIKFPGKIETKTFKKADPKAGIVSMSGNKLTLDRDAIAEYEEVLSESSLQALRVYGKSTTFPLKKDSYYSMESKNDKSVEHRFFYGTITSVQMDIPGDWQEVTIPFKVTKAAEKNTKKK